MEKEVVKKTQSWSRKDQKIYEKTRKYLQKMNDPEIDEKMEVISQALAKEEGEERYSYLYDQICEYLDREFREKNICGFHNNLCKRRCDMKSRKVKKDTYENGCCHSYLHGRDCEHLKPPFGCQIKNIGCKTFTCYFLRKQGYRYTLDKIYLSRYFFNRRQKFYIENTFFVDKPIIMIGILKRR